MFRSGEEKSEGLRLGGRVAEITIVGVCVRRGE